MRRRQTQNDQPELNLAPIMNMVVILIPLLLLSVVFLRVGVVNVSTPSLTPGAASGGEETSRVTLAVGATGFIVSSNQGEIGRVEVEDPKAARRALDRARSAYDAGDVAAAEAALRDFSSSFGWSELYATMRRAKETNPAVEVVHLTADADVPYALVIKAMDAVRFRLPKDEFRSETEFWAANLAANSNPSAEPLFPDPVLTIAR